MLLLRNVSGMFVLAYCLGSWIVYAQNPDSVELKIARAQGLAKAEALSDGVALFVRSDLQKARNYVEETYELSRSDTDPMLEAYAYLNQGLLIVPQGKYDSAILLIKNGEQIARKSGNANFLIRSGVALGRIFIGAGNPEQALSNLYSTLKLLETSPQPETEMKVRVNVTWAYLELKRYRDCIAFGKESLASMKPEFEYMVPYLCNNMAASYGAIGQVDSARQLVLRGIPIAEKRNDYNLVANAYFILGSGYSQVGQYDLAIAQFQKAKPYREKIGNPLFIVSDLYVLSDLYYKKGDYKSGVKYGLEGLAIAERNNLTLKFEGVYQSLAKNYEALGDYKNSSKYYSLLASAKDSVYQNANADALAEMQTRYETEKKEQQIVFLNQENELKTATIQRNYFSIGGLLALIALIVLTFYLWRYREVQKQKAVFQEQKVRLREAQVKAVIESQESERKRFAEDLHDGMGQLISALHLNIHSLKQNRETANRDRLFENSEQILADIHSEIRNIAFNLMPPVLIKEGIISGLQELIRRINKSGTIKVSLSHHDMPARLNEMGEISIYRIIQEFLSNIIKHSSATQVTIDFTGFDNEIVLTIEDDSRGYNLEQFQNSEGNGWRNINSRLNLIKGTIELDIVEGRKNSTVIIAVPMASIHRAVKDTEPAIKN
jgi:signal transduction histidine kinase/tetratricopeptide (TPR) repeat protein